MRYFLKLADANGYFEEVDKYTFDNYKSALNEKDEPRYLLNNWVMATEDGNMSMQLTVAPQRDIAILTRVLDVFTPAKVEGGFVREPVVIKFRKGKGLVMREMKSGQNWKAA